MRGHIIRARGLRIILLFALAAVAGHAPGETLDTTVTIGENWTVVRELRRVDLVAGEQVVYLDDIPAHADLSSLIIRTRRIPVDLLDWERVRPEPGGADDTGSAFLLTPGGVQSSPDLPRGEGPLRCRIRIPVGGARSLEIIYRTSGIRWAAQYQVNIRGEPDGLDESVSLDLTGYVRIKNETGRAFTNTLVRLVGADPRLPRAPEPQPGFLLLAESPLSSLWESQEVDAPPEFMYRLPRRAEIPARSESEIHFITSHRIPSSRLYVMDSERVPLTLTGAFHPLQQYLVFNNTADNRLGWTLPPGPVDVYHGVTRRTALPPGFLPHTGINREIRIDLGASPMVRGMRRVLQRTELQFGFYEELYRLVIESARPAAIAVEINERPPVALAWTVERASEEHEITRGRVRMQPRLRARETREIDLRLQYREPTL
jgi:hypothetical protein